MSKFVLICSSIILIGFLSTQLMPKNIKIPNQENAYSGLPICPTANKPLKLTSSLISDPKTIEESTNTTPCLMPMIVPKEFSEGYKDKKNGDKAKLNTHAYLEGYKLAEKDLLEGKDRLLMPQTQSFD